MMLDAVWAARGDCRVCVCVCVCVCGSGAVALTDHRMMENRQRASSLGATYELYEYLHFLLPVPL